MKKFFLLLLAFPLLGSGCFFPQRKHTFIPPTSLENNCQQDGNYFNSVIYRFCLKFPNDNWSRISVSLPIDILGTNITTFNFYSIQEKFSVFTLYVAEPKTVNKAIYERELIPLIHEEPYLVGYSLNPDDNLPPDLQRLHEDVEEMVKSMQFE